MDVIEIYYAHNAIYTMRQYRSIASNQEIFLPHVPRGCVDYGGDTIYKKYNSALLPGKNPNGGT